MESATVKKSPSCIALSLRDRRRISEIDVSIQVTASFQQPLLHVRIIRLTPAIRNRLKKVTSFKRSVPLNRTTLEARLSFFVSSN